MRTIVKLAVLPIALAVAALVGSLAPRAGAAAPADVSGNYAGKMAFRFYPLIDGDSPSRGSLLSTGTVTLNAPLLSIVVTVETPEGPENYTLQGRYGLGRFWVAGGGPGGQMSINGTAKGAAGKLVLAGSGSLVSPDALNTIKLNLKQTQVQ